MVSQTTSTQTQATGREYQTITESEFDEFMGELAVFEKSVPTGAAEVAYDIPLPVENLVVRVWSTIERGQSRAKDTDAIRTVVWDTELQEPIGGREKTQRIGPTASNPEGWKGNLRPKIKDLVENWRRFDKVCDECGGRMALREPDQGDDYTAFWGCTNFPRCEYTESAD